MSKNTTEQNTFVLEYQGDAESTEAAFNHLIESISDRSPEITGFRVELSTANSFDSPFAFSGQTNTGTDAGDKAETSKHDDGDEINSNGDTTSVPSLRSDALPAQVLSLLCDGDADTKRSSELQDEFDDADIDTARISQTLASLKRRELVAAKPDPEDKRANIYWPTKKGQQALKN